MEDGICFQSNVSTSKSVGQGGTPVKRHYPQNQQAEEAEQTVDSLLVKKIEKRKRKRKKKKLENAMHEAK